MQNNWIHFWQWNIYVYKIEIRSIKKYNKYALLLVESVYLNDILLLNIIFYILKAFFFGLEYNKTVLFF